MRAARDFPQSDESALPPMQDGETRPLRLLAIKTRTEPDQIARFQRETGALQIKGLVPLTYPFCWLGLPAIRSMIRQMIGEGFLPVHEAQSFAYERRLEINADYLISVELRRAADPPRLCLDATISTPQGEPCGRLNMVLRLVPIASEPTP